MIKDTWSKIIETTRSKSDDIILQSCLQGWKSPSMVAAIAPLCLWAFRFQTFIYGWKIKFIGAFPYSHVWHVQGYTCCVLKHVVSENLTNVCCTWDNVVFQLFCPPGLARCTNHEHFLLFSSLFIDFSSLICA